MEKIKKLYIAVVVWIALAMLRSVKLHVTSFEVDKEKNEKSTTPIQG